MKNIFCLKLKVEHTDFLLMSYELILANLQKRSNRLIWKWYALAVLNQNKPHCLNRNIEALQQGRVGLRYDCMLNVSIFYLYLFPFLKKKNVLFLWWLNKIWRNLHYSIPFLSHVITSEIASALCEHWLVFLLVLFLLEGVQNHHQQTARSPALNCPKQCVERRSVRC